MIPTPRGKSLLSGSKILVDMRSVAALILTGMEDEMAEGVADVTVELRTARELSWVRCTVLRELTRGGPSLCQRRLRLPIPRYRRCRRSSHR
jgi:hypothetical protein